MVNYYGDFAEDDTVNIPFNTFDSNDPSASVTITNLADADIKVHKDGGLTQLVTDGATVVIDFDSITGNHMVTIDTSAHADYTTGSEYAVRIEGTTVDAGTVNAWIGSFSIERAGGVLALLKATTLASIKAETALIVADTNELQSDDVPGLIATLDAVVDTVKVDTAAILVDTAEIGAAGAGLTALATQASVNTVDSNVDAILVDTGTTIPATIATVDSNVDAILVDTGTTIPATIATVDANVDSILVDTGTTLDTKLNDIQGASFSSVSDSLEAIRDRGDSAWTGSATTSDSGTAQAGASDTITLQSGASAVNDTYNGQVIFINAGTGVSQSRAISDYVGSTKVATVISAWATTPDATSVYEIFPNDITELTTAPTAAVIADAVWDENTAGHTTSGTFGEQVKNDIDAILADTGELQADWVDGGRLDLIQDSILVDTAGIATVDTNVDAILVDTGTTIPATIATVDTNVDAILVDTGTTIPATIATVDANVDSILADTGTDGVVLAAAQSVDVDSINGVTIIGDGSGTPFDV